MPELSDIIDVQVQLASPGVPRRDFGKTLMLTSDANVLSPGGSGKVRAFTRQSEVAALDFDSGVETASARYFGQDPYPNTLLIGRWVPELVNHQIFGGSPDAIGVIEPVSDGAFVFADNLFAGGDFSSDGSYADVATGVQALILATPANWATSTSYALGARVTRGTNIYRALSAHTSKAGDATTANVLDPAIWAPALDTTSATAVYEASPGRLVVTFPLATEGVTGVFSSPPDGAGTDVSSILGLSSSAGARFAEGSAAETVGDALAAIRRETSVDFSQLVLDPALDGTQSMLDASDWANANRTLFFAGSSEAGATTAGEDATFAARLASGAPQYAAGVWSKTNDGKACSLAGFHSSVNFDAGGSLRTGHLAQLPGTLRDRLTPGEEAELTRKNWNFTGYQGRLHDGRLLNAEWIDVRQFALWFENALQTDLYQLLVDGKLPLTDYGMQVIKDTITAVCEQGVLNGGIASRGTAPAAMKADIQQTTGNDAFDGTLSKGYLVWAPSVSTLTAAQRLERVTPGFRVWALGGGFVHSVSLVVTFQP